MSDAPSQERDPLRRFLDECAEFARAQPMLRATGRLTRVAGLVMEAVGLRLPVGSTVVVSQGSTQSVEAEVVGFSGDRLFLMPYDEPVGLMPGAVVRPNDADVPSPQFGPNQNPWRRLEERARMLPVGWEMLGRVVDSNGRPLDKRGPLVCQHRRSLRSKPINPIDRAAVERTLDVGVRSINGLLTVGRGQRLGLFAGSGVGKSVLLGMMARFTEAEIIVVGLIGERGREVKEFIEQILGTQGLRKSVVVAAPADVPPLLRMQGAAYATSIAEYFRDEGKHVLLLMDSLTRYAMAAREIALAIGEPPATKGYPPSVFAKLPALVERTGNGPNGGGSITAFYTVLSEGDDQQDPIADSARAILDGHVVLSRSLADQGHYPAIDIEASISRAMTSLIPAAQFEQVRRFKSLYSRLQRSRDLITVGAYTAGNDVQLDQAIALESRMMAYLQQNMNESDAYAQCVARLNQLFTA